MNTTYVYVQIQLRADTRWTKTPIFSEIHWEGLFDAKLELETEREGDSQAVGCGTAYIPPRLRPDDQSRGRAPGRCDRDDRGRPSHSRVTESEE